MIKIIDKYIHSFTEQLQDRSDNYGIKLLGAIEALNAMKQEVIMEQKNATPETSGEGAEVSPKKARRRATKTAAN